METQLFWLAVVANGLLLIGMISNVVRISDHQFWPPPHKHSWQFYALWWSVRIIVVAIVVLAYFEWGTMNVSDNARFWVALPILCISFSIGGIAALNLGWKNTHGIENGFIEHGLYRYSRNPQYVLFSISFIAASIFIASPKAMILLWLLALWYLIAPFPEERWLEERYGDQYLNYKQRVPRYL
jgi:protein-S-isoprenylcysteine O-methyltransferase Ste14